MKLEDAFKILKAHGKTWADLKLDCGFTGFDEPLPCDDLSFMPIGEDCTPDCPVMEMAIIKEAYQMQEADKCAGRTVEFIDAVYVTKILKHYTKAEWDAICKRCGYCCKLCKQDENGNWVQEGDCPNLKRLSNGKTECTIYENCYGTHLSETTWCAPVERVLKRAPNCPYNKILEGNEIFRVEEPEK
jgi:uncharacterized cysteine cluster protein YcgN (CxxCxxCC family)